LVFLKNEDLSREPIHRFRSIYKSLGLDFNEKIKNKIKKRCFIKENNYYINSKKGVKRNSIKNITAWKKRLSFNEIKRIKKGTSDIYPKFYGEKEW